MVIMISYMAMVGLIILGVLLIVVGIYFQTHEVKDRDKYASSLIIARPKYAIALGVIDILVAVTKRVVV